ncbi:MAG: hypothetical protein V1928_05295 [Parcubacteria group bacterium]
MKILNSRTCARSCLKCASLRSCFERLIDAFPWRGEMIRRESAEINQPPKTRTVFPGVVVLPTGKCCFITQEEETEFYH